MSQQTPSTEHLIELGVSGLRRSGGYIYEERLKELQGRRWRDIIAEMAYDPVAAAISFAVDMFIRRVKWQMKAAGQTPVDQQRAEFAWSCLNDMSSTWTDTVSEILTMLPYGWAYLEMVYKQRKGENPLPITGPDGEVIEAAPSNYSDGRIGFRKWGIRAQDTLLRWEFDDRGGVQGLWQIAPPNYQLTFIPIEKSLLFRTSSRKGNPEGESIFRGAYTSWYYKTNIQRVEAIGIERDMAGVPFAGVPVSMLSSRATSEQQETLALIKRIVTGVRRDEVEGIVWPLAYDANNNPLYDFKLLSAGGTRQFDTDTIISRYDQRMAMTILADFILLGHENVGSFSLSEDKSSLFTSALESWMDGIADVINRYALPRLFKLNGMPTKNMPKLTHERMQQIDLSELASFVSSLAGSNVIIPDGELERHLRQQANLPFLNVQEGPRQPAPQAPTALPGVPALPGAQNPFNMSERETRAFQAALHRAEGVYGG